MQCDDFNSRLNQVLDRRHDPHRDRLLQAHVTQCPECRSKLRLQAVLLNGVRARRARRCDPNLAARVAALSAGGRVRRNSRLLVAGGLSALAASWLIFFLPGSGRHFEGGGIEAVAVSIGQVRSTDVDERSVSPRRQAIATQRGREVVPSGAVPPGRDEDDPIAIEDRALTGAEYGWFQDLILHISDSNLNEFESVDQIAGGLRPIASTLNVALDALRRSLPRSRPATSPPAGDSAHILRPGSLA